MNERAPFGWALPVHPNFNDLSNPQTVCPCGRRTTADMVADLRGIQEAVRTRYDLPDFACDACRARWHRDGRISRKDLLTALGAPAAMILHLERKGCL